MNSKVKRTTPLWLILIGLLMLRSTYYSNDPLEEEYIKSVISPNEEYKMNAYRYNDETNMDWFIRIEIEYISTGKKKNFYCNYYNYEPSIKWIDNNTVNINGQKLNINTDTFDCCINGMDH